MTGKWKVSSSLVLLLSSNVSVGQTAVSREAQTLEAQLSAADASHMSVVMPMQKFETSAADVEIDGVLDEAVWGRITPINEMRVTDPETLSDVPFDTETRIFYTSRGVYVSVDMEQPLDTIVQRISSRDNTTINRDSVTVTLDTSGQGLFGYWMMLALGDNQADGTVLPERQYRTEWDGAWYGATQTTERGWSAEFFMPWGQMAMPQEEAVRRMGISVVRDVAHLDQSWGWPAIPESSQIFMSDLPLLEFQGVNLRQQWSVFPFVSVTQDQIDKEQNTKTGFDVFWRPSSNFQLTGTVNPDFGSVESDNVVVNLTANETFYPEKRLFFQEGQEIFNTTPRSTGSNGQRFTVVNTRRIGGRPRVPDLPAGVRLSARDRIKPAELLGALKATGQAGAVRYGMLTAAEDDTIYKINGAKYIQEGRDFNAFRLIYEDSNGAAYRGLGYIGTLVQHPQSDAVVHAVDFHYLSSGGRWNVDGQVISSDSDERGSGRGAFADIIYSPRQGIRHNLQLTAFDDKIDVNDLGFQQRNDNMEAWYRFEWIKTDLKFVRNFRFNPFLRYEENRAGDRTNNMLPLINMSATLNNLDRVSVQFQQFPKRYDDRNSFGNGTFATRERTSYFLDYTTNPSLPVSISAGYSSIGELVSGRTLETRTGVTWRPMDNVNLSARIAYNDRSGWLLHQGGQDFTAFDATQWEGQVNVDYFATAKQQLTMALQWVGIKAFEDVFYYLPRQAETKNRDLIKVPKPAGPTDSFSLSQLNFQLRYRWQIAPLSDLFVVYTRGDNVRAQIGEFEDLFEQSWNDPLGEQLVVKLRYRFGT